MNKYRLRRRSAHINTLPTDIANIIFDFAVEFEKIKAHSVLQELEIYFHIASHFDLMNEMMFDEDEYLFYINILDPAPIECILEILDIYNDALRAGGADELDLF